MFTIGRFRKQAPCPFRSNQKGMKGEKELSELEYGLS